MKWDDVCKIMDGKMCLLGAPPQARSALTQHTKDALQCLQTKFAFASATDTLLRVAILVMQAVEGLDVTVKLQPSIENHPIFTDVYIVIQQNAEGVAFIEVKNPSIAVHLESESPAVAQTLREAHILTTARQGQASIPFVLTNGFEWSFGQACRKGPKIAITRRFFLSINLDQPDTVLWNQPIEHVIHALRALIQGVWPAGQTDRDL